MSVTTETSLKDKLTNIAAPLTRLLGGGGKGGQSYAVGSVSIEEGSDKLVGVGTNWSSLTPVDGPVAGKITIDGGTEVYGVKSIESDTQITLTKSFTRASVANAGYAFLSNAPASAPAEGEPDAWLDTFRTIGYALLIAVVIRAFFFQPFNIPSGSMIPTLLVGDYLFVSKFSYGYSKHSLPWSPNLFGGRVLSGQPERGDVIVFKLPSDGRTDYIKRLIGLPGDRVQMKSGVLHINGTAVERKRVESKLCDDGMKRGQYRFNCYLETLPNGVSYYTRDVRTSEWDDTIEYVVPEGHYFMMGDNRDNSTDSRVPPFRNGVGFVPYENLVGRADMLFFSTDGTARFWEVWRWVPAARFGRIFQFIE